MYLSPQITARALQGLPRGRYLMGARISRRSSLRYLSALTPDQAVESIFPAARVGKSAGHNQAVRDVMMQAVQTGTLVGAHGQPAYIPGTADCAGAKGSIKAPVLTAIGGTAIKLAVVSGPGAPFVLAAGAVMSVVGFISGIFTHHHQQAVAKERGTLCVAVPAAQNALLAVDQALQQRQMTAAQAADAMDEIVNDFKSYVSGIIHGSDPTSRGECNAACVMLSELRAIAAYKKSAYQDMSVAAPSGSSTSGGAAGAVTGAVAQAAAQFGIPPLALYAIGGLLLWKLL